MPNYGIFTNFIFCMYYLKKERKQVEKKQKRWKMQQSLRDIIFVCRDTKFKQAEGTMSQPATKCRNKAQT